MKRAACAVRLARCLRGKVRSHALDVLHDRDGIVKNVAIDVLQNVASRRGRRLARNEKRVIDVPAAVRRQAQNFAAEFKLARRGLSVGQRTHDQRLSG